MATTREEELEKALNGFIWLGNNLHNKQRPLFDEMYEACLKDARNAIAMDTGAIRPDLSVEEKLLDIERSLAFTEADELMSVRGLIGSAITIVRLWVARYA